LSSSPGQQRLAGLDATHLRTLRAAADPARFGLSLYFFESEPRQQ
jgi:hypothetical protein